MLLGFSWELPWSKRGDNLGGSTTEDISSNELFIGGSSNIYRLFNYTIFIDHW
jgi:hypothetical protein